MTGLGEFALPLGHEVIAPEPDVRLERREFRPLVPIHRKAGRQNEEVKREPAARVGKQTARLPRVLSSNTRLSLISMPSGAQFANREKFSCREARSVES